MKQIKLDNEVYAMLKALAKAYSYHYSDKTNYMEVLNGLVRSEWDNPAWALCNDREDEVKKYRRTVAIRDNEYTRIISK